jgi:hypothetical protein
MDKIVHCRAMASFCRQHAQFENEDTCFWIDGAKEWDNLITELLDSTASDPNWPNGRALQTL